MCSTHFGLRLQVMVTVLNLILLVLKKNFLALFLSFLRWLSWSVIFRALGNFQSVMFHHQTGCTPWAIARVRSSCAGNEWFLGLFTQYCNHCLAQKSGKKNSISSMAVYILCRISMHLTSSERRSTSTDPQSGMERKSHLVLRRSSGWLTPPLPEPDERGTSLLSSFSSSCLSTLSSVLTFPQHDERLGYIYVLLLFLFPAVCQTNLNLKKGMGIKWSKRVKIMEGK